MREGAFSSSWVSEGAFSSGWVREGVFSSGWVREGAFSSGWVREGAFSSGWVREGAFSSGWVREGAFSSGWVREGAFSSSWVREGVFSSGWVREGAFSSGWVHYVLTLAKSYYGDVGTSSTGDCPAEIVRHQQEQMRLVEQLRKQEERLHTVYGAPPSGAGAALANPMVHLQGQLPSLFGEMKQEVRGY